jgi:hypothetical protein
MKKFIIKIFIFLLPITLSSYLIDYFISSNLKKSNSHAQKEYPIWNIITEGKLNSEILIYGSSRAWTHFDSQIIENKLNKTTYNLGIDGHTFNMQYLRHLIVLKNNKKPKLIIHSIDVGTFQKGNLYNPDQFLPYMLWNKEFFKTIKNYEGYNFIDFYIPLIRYYGKLDAIKTAIKMFVLPQNNSIERIKGYQGQDVGWNNDFDDAQKNMDKYEVTLDSLTLVKFDKYLAQCKSNNIEVILVYSPIYIEGQNFIKNHQEIIELYQSFADKYSFKFINFLTDIICLDKKYFYNATHLNKLGAELFSHKLSTLLLELNKGKIK